MYLEKRRRLRPCKSTHQCVGPTCPRCTSRPLLGGAHHPAANPHGARPSLLVDKAAAMYLRREMLLKRSLRQSFRLSKRPFGLGEIANLWPRPPKKQAKQAECTLSRLLQAVKELCREAPAVAAIQSLTAHLGCVNG